MNQTMEQRRAAHAWEMVGEGIERFHTDYVNGAKGLPALIMNSGLMQVMAFLEGKRGRHALLGKHLRAWLHESHETPLDFEGFMQRLLEAGPREFQDLSAEAFAWLKWLRQMAAAREEHRHTGA